MDAKPKRFQGNSPLARLLLVVAALNLAVGLLVGVAIWSAMRHAHEDAAQESRNLTILVERYFTEMFDKTDFALRTLSHELVGHGVPGVVDSERLDAFFAGYVNLMSDIDRFGITNAAGRVIYANTPDASLTDVSEREFFTSRITTASDALYASSARTGVAENALYLSRRVANPDGTFAGVVFARLPLGSVSAFLSRLDIGDHGGISFRDLNMALLARHPDPGDKFRGNRTISRELREFLDRGDPRGTYFSGTTWDGTARTVSFARLGTYPFYVNVGLAEEDYLEGWRQNSLQLVALYLGFIALTLIFALLAHWVWRARAHEQAEAVHELERRVAESTASLREYSEALERSNAQLRHLAISDPLTGLANRRHFIESANGEIERALRHAKPLTLLMMDIDRFKSINDTWGHAVGDVAIQKVAEACQEAVRVIDTVARLGGEEFALLLPETDLVAGAMVAERLRIAIAAIRIPTGTEIVAFTASIGVAELTHAEPTLKRLLKRADDALYLAKQLGRDRCEIAAP
jgi:diguanylate cyclase (GGDEF)-like protein